MRVPLATRRESIGGNTQSKTQTYWLNLIPGGNWLKLYQVADWHQHVIFTSEFSSLRLRQWPVTYLITLSDWIMSCQPGSHAVVTVCEPDWKHKWAAYKSFDETSSFNNL